MNSVRINSIERSTDILKVLDKRRTLSMIQGRIYKTYTNRTFAWLVTRTSPVELNHDCQFFILQKEDSYLENSIKSTHIIDNRNPQADLRARQFMRI